MSRKLGEGDRQGANELFSFVIAVTVGIGLVLGALLLLFLKPVIWLLGANEALFPYCYQYAMPMLCFLPMSILQIQFQSLIVAAAKLQLGLCMTIISGVTNILLDSVFMGVFHRGIAGAAIATGWILYSGSVSDGPFSMEPEKAAFRLIRPVSHWRQLAAAAANRLLGNGELSV